MRAHVPQSAASFVSSGKSMVSASAPGQRQFLSVELADQVACSRSAWSAIARLRFRLVIVDHVKAVDDKQRVDLAE